MLLTNPGLLPAVDKCFMDSIDADFSGVSTDIGFRDLDDGKRMLERCMSVLM